MKNVTSLADIFHLLSISLIASQLAGSFGHNGWLTCAILKLPSRQMEIMLKCSSAVPFVLNLKFSFCHHCSVSWMSLVTVSYLILIVH